MIYGIAGYLFVGTMFLLFAFRGCLSSGKASVLVILGWPMFMFCTIQITNKLRKALSIAHNDMNAICKLLKVNRMQSSYSYEDMGTTFFLDGKGYTVYDWEIERCDLEGNKIAFLLAKKVLSK